MRHEADFRLAECGILGCDNDIGGHCEDVTGGERKAVHGGDGGLAQVPQLHQGAGGQMLGVPSRSRRDVGRILAGRYVVSSGECPTLSGKYQHIDVVVVVHIVERITELP